MLRHPVTIVRRGTCSTAGDNPGVTASGVDIVLYELTDQGRREIVRMTTDYDGRTDHSLLDGDRLRAGTFEIDFHVGAYFSSGSAVGAKPVFLDIVPVRFTIADPSQPYHVPLLMSPWSYTMYRGS